MFSISTTPISSELLTESLQNEKAGAIVVFHGWVRDHNEGKKVKSLEYQIYRELALKEGKSILEEAKKKFNLHGIMAVHREGHLALGEIAIWIGATSSHRDDAFKATRYVIDEIKHRLPVWKKEHYLYEKPEWVFCKDHHHHVHFSEKEFYSKQSALVNQEKLKNAKVLVVGAGGLGCPVLLSFAGAGVGHITIVDHDVVCLSNLHRQSLYSVNLVGEKKAIIAAKKIQELNSFIHVEGISERVREDHLLHDLVIDCTDNLETKYFLHDLCHKLRLPLISASVYQNEGQIRTFIPGKGCLRCVLSVTPDDSLLGNCNDFGVIGAVTNTMGSLQASEAIKFLSTGENATTTHTLFFNINDLSIMKVKNLKKEGCLTCAGEVHFEVHSVEVTGGMEILDIRNLTDEEVYAIRPQKVALCCHKGIRSKRLAMKLQEEGHDVYSLKGGACSL